MSIPTEKLFREIDGVQHFIPAEERMTAVELTFYYRGHIAWEKDQLAELQKRVEERGVKMSHAKFATPPNLDTVDVMTNAIASDCHAMFHLRKSIAKHEEELAKYPMSVL